MPRKGPILGHTFVGSHLKSCLFCKNKDLGAVDCATCKSQQYPLQRLHQKGVNGCWEVIYREDQRVRMLEQTQHEVGVESSRSHRCFTNSNMPCRPERPEYADASSTPLTLKPCRRLMRHGGSSLPWRSSPRFM